MALSSTSRPGIRGRVIPRVPATFQATGGLAVSKANGVWTLEPDWTALTLETTIPDPEARQIWSLDPNTGTYYRISVQAFIDSLPAGPTGATGATGPGYTATSTTSLAVGTGSKAFTTQAGLAYSTGARVRAASAANGANFMEGLVTSYTGTTLTVNVTLTGGSGTLADWNINLAGQPGTGDLLSTNNLSDVANTATAFANIKQAATTTATGVSELATDAEAQAKADTARTLTPSNLAALGSSATFAGFVELATDAETQTGTDTARAITPANLTAAAVKQGKHTIWIPANAMTARTTNGAAAGTAEMATNKNMFKTLDFDTTTQEFAQFEVFFPKSWNLGTVTFQPVVSHASGSGNAVFGLAGVARSSDDAGDVAFGTAQTSDTTVGTANDIYIGPESAAITIAGTPAAGDTVQFQINRTVASDNLGVDARLHGIRLFYTINAATDT